MTTLGTWESAGHFSHISQQSQLTLYLCRWQVSEDGGERTGRGTGPFLGEPLWRTRSDTALQLHKCWFDRQTVDHPGDLEGNHLYPPHLLPQKLRLYGVRRDWRNWDRMILTVHPAHSRREKAYSHLYTSTVHSRGHSTALWSPSIYGQDLRNTY